MKLRNKKTGKIIKMFNNTDGILPNTLAELNEEWEDASAEPLIKDEEIREAVRTWADTYEIVAVRHKVLSFDKIKHSVIETGYGSDYTAITLETELDLTDGETYTIAELCGEEK